MAATFPNAGVIIVDEVSCIIDGITVTSDYPQIVPEFGRPHPKPRSIERCPIGGNGKHARGWRPMKPRNR